MTTIVVRQLLGPHLNRTTALTICEQHDVSPDEEHLALDFRGCLIDYPETARIVEKLTGRARPTLKQLTITTDQDFPDQLLLHLLLKGGDWWPLGTDYTDFRSKFREASTRRPKNVLVILLDHDNAEIRRIEL
jgi:hypothetical protein